MTTTDTTNTDPTTPVDQGQPTDSTATIDTPVADPTAQGPHDDDRTPERKMRHRAQSAEAERDAARDLAERLQRAEICRLAGDRLASPADVLDPTLGGVALANILDENGLVDTAKLDAAIEAQIDARPGLAVAELRKPQRGTYPNSGQFQSPRQPTATGSNWGNVKLR